jgi:hypothetical protein
MGNNSTLQTFLLPSGESLLCTETPGGTKMNSVDISPLVKGILVVIGIAIATGHYGDLQTWTRGEAAEAVMWRRPLPYFFAPPSQSAGKALRLPQQTAMPRNRLEAPKSRKNFNIAIVRTSALQ